MLRLEDSPLIWVQPSAGSLNKDMEEGSFCLLPAYLHLASTCIPLLALEPTSLGFQHILKTSLDTQPCRLSNYWIFGFSVNSQPLLG